jgi:hypothetical protein
MNAERGPDFVRRRHYEMLVVAGGALLLALALRVRDDGRVVFWGLPDYPLPPSCPTYALFGVKCPGCGLTRSVVELAQGHWASSWHFHRLGWLIGLVILLQIPYRLLALRARGRPPLGSRLPELVGYVLIFALIANWLIDCVLLAVG